MEAVDLVGVVSSLEDNREVAGWHKALVWDGSWVLYDLLWSVESFVGAFLDCQVGRVIDVGFGSNGPNAWRWIRQHLPKDHFQAQNRT